MKRMIIMFLSISLLTGTSLVIMSEHWFPMWLGLELSTLSIIPLLKNNIKSRSKEATMKYFLIQALSAAMLLKGATLKLWLSNSWKMKEIKKTPIASTMMTLAMMMKLGLAPCHFWFPDVLSGISFLKGMMIACWQKMAPLFMTMSMSKKMSKEMMIICATMSVLVGGWGGLNQMSMRKILAYSSISHLGWMTATLFFTPEASLMLFMFYIMNKTMMFLMCSKKNLMSLSKLKKTKMMPLVTMMFSLTLLSMGGLPPLGGFMKKLIPLKMFLKNKKGMIMPLFIMGSLTSLYFYLRMVFKTSLTLFPQHSMKILLSKTKNKKKTKMIMSLLSPLPMWGIILIPMFYSFM